LERRICLVESMVQNSQNEVTGFAGMTDETVGIVEVKIRIGGLAKLKHNYFNEKRAHFKDNILKFRNKYSQKRKIGVSVPISTFMRL
jgi:hypothetical protein